MPQQQLWYTRRDKEIRGPFPAPQISRFILLGRIHDIDELSTDQHNWQKVSDVPVLIPAELKADLSDPEAHEKLLVARMREDERSARERRDLVEENTPQLERRQRSDDSDRREQEEREMLRHREIKTAIIESARHRSQHYFLRGVLATLLLVGVISAAWYYQPWVEGNAPTDCNMAPQPWVNWNNCMLEGQRLASIDLRGARLRNSNLAGADLRGAKLGGADLAYANLVGANMVAATLGQAVLMGANLHNANLSAADFSRANMTYAILRGVDLRSANLTDADLSHADLQGAKVITATLTGA
ncbi:MAG: pentapeptide repeat-containing protein, partial [Gammaproteobacteria bacterium]|nr:pentapeptide repeat-containing protein [Gammaproteobacteria bacterium]